MKKYMFVCAGLAVALAFTSCKSSESAYRKAYDKAKAQEEANLANNNYGSEETPVVAPVQTRPSTETVVVDNVDNVSVRPEKLQVVDGTGLKSFSVVVGSFSVKANAVGLAQRLRNAGYPAQVAFNSSNNMYRVVATTFDDKASAVRSRNDFRAGEYADAWLLFNQQ
jgi:cell division septation protein DedD